MLGFPHSWEGTQLQSGIKRLPCGGWDPLAPTQHQAALQPHCVWDMWDLSPVPSQEPQEGGEASPAGEGRGGESSSGFLQNFLPSTRVPVGAKSFPYPSRST